MLATLGASAKSALPRQMGCTPSLCFLLLGPFPTSFVGHRGVDLSHTKQGQGTHRNSALIPGLPGINIHPSPTACPWDKALRPRSSANSGGPHKGPALPSCQLPQGSLTLHSPPSPNRQSRPVLRPYTDCSLCETPLLSTPSTSVFPYHLLQEVPHPYFSG